MSASSPAQDPAPWWDRPDPSGWRVIVPAALALVIQVAAVIGAGPRPWMRDFFRGGPVRPDVDLWLTLGFAIAGPLLLLAARVAPGPVVAAVTAVSVVDLALSDDAQRAPLIALAFAVISAVARGARVWAWASVSAGILLVIIFSPGFNEDLQATQVGAAAVLLIVAFGIGEAFRASRARRVQVRREAQVLHDTAVRAERERIARELHDVLAHSLSQISVQAGVGLHLSDEGRPDQLDRARDALGNIRSASAIALDDVRSVIGALRSPGEAPLVPEPQWDDIHRLVMSAREAGLEVLVSADTAEGVPRAVQAAAYRILQESLTNAVRHGGARNVTVTMTVPRAPGTSAPGTSAPATSAPGTLAPATSAPAVESGGGALVLEVTDDGRPTATVPGTGLGLAGMAERAALLGGTLVAGPLPAGGWRVRAELPLHPEATP